VLRYSCFLAFSLLFATGCARGPRNATEAKAKMPRVFAGSVTFDGERAGRRVRVLTDSLRVRDEHTLEFERVHFYVLAPLSDDTLFDEIVETHGTIDVPGLDIHVNEHDLGRAGGEPLTVRAGSFHGQLSADLRTVHAEWFMPDPNTGAERKAELKLRAP